MQLYIMRHGQASPIANSDAERQLTKQGHFEAEIMGKWLKNMQVNLDHLLVSPYVRAQQTAAMVKATLNWSGPSTNCDFITPSGNAAQVHDYLDGMLAQSQGKSSTDKGIETLLVVSHMPLVSYLVEDLTFDRKSPIFQTAGIAQINYDLGRMKGELVRLVSPHDLC
ncbi:phosphohistidine phosphatase SixA [Thalassomonas haliotis]|uniref:Phosphohistidine phosphatase SixA n=1 Tax=Thalassomonas haliotis TaxID=485448 RepID=A0ABY7VK01_9GAMM|nr:phosphohistidine phosphatase SixA [Thalassomonas haliotis]WDE13330.1 phosphohistidine phosphatase SixA [Thalassomonas haliotis]